MEEKELAVKNWLAHLPEKAFIKQIGTMTSRGELDIMRLVIMFPSWESIFPGLTAIGWQGDTAELASALQPWKESQKIAVNIDLGADGVLPKIGIEVFSRWRHPLIVDKFIMRLEDAGLCLPEKGEALRRWIRLRPDADPFRQTLINYFKLNYKDGKITEAKAYLEQTPYINHHYFDAYEFPGRVDFYLRDGERKRRKMRRRAAWNLRWKAAFHRCVPLWAARTKRETETGASDAAARREVISSPCRRTAVSRRARIWTRGKRTVPLRSIGNIHPR